MFGSPKLPPMGLIQVGRVALLINVFSTQDFSKFQKAGEWGPVKQPQESDLFVAQDGIVPKISKDVFDASPAPK